jgi:large subunit ribosomal protein L7A
MLESLKTGNKTAGLKQSLKAVEAGRAKAVFIAADADERVVAGLKQLCERNGVSIIPVESMKQLGKACGIQVETAVACLLK